MRCRFCRTSPPSQIFVCGRRRVIGSCQNSRFHSPDMVAERQTHRRFHATTAGSVCMCASQRSSSDLIASRKWRLQHNDLFSSHRAVLSLVDSPRSAVNSEFVRSVPRYIPFSEEAVLSRGSSSSRRRLPNSSSPAGYGLVESSSQRFIIFFRPNAELYNELNSTTNSNSFTFSFSF